MNNAEDLVTMELDLNDDAMFVANLFINEGRRREREEIIQDLIHELGHTSCCCDASTGGNHYLSHSQPDNIIDLIKRRKIG